jgi:hypothetical protein
MFDLSTLDTRGASERGAVLTLKHPVTGDELRTKNGESVTITLLGIDSEKSEALQREVQRKALKRAGFKKRTPEQIENEGLNLLAGLTVAWTNVGRGDEELPCTTENAKAIYKEFPWIRSQVDEFVGDVSNYLGN